MLDRLGEAVIVLDHQRILRHVNDAARRLLGYERGQEIGGVRVVEHGVAPEALGGPHPADGEGGEAGTIAHDRV